MSIIALDHVTKRFGETIALNDFSLHVEAGELFGLLGPNGAGKTTAISVMLNLYPADSGTIRIFDQSMPKDEQTIKRRVGIVPQHVSVYDQLTVFENIQFFAELYGFKPAEAKQKSVAALDFVELTPHQKKRPPELPGGSFVVSTSPVASSMSRNSSSWMSRPSPSTRSHATPSSRTSVS